MQSYLLTCWIFHISSSSCFLHSASRAVPSAYLRLLMFLPPIFIFIPVYWHYLSHDCLGYRVKICCERIQPCLVNFLILNHSVSSHVVLRSWFNFLVREKWSVNPHKVTSIISFLRDRFTTFPVDCNQRPYNNQLNTYFTFMIFLWLMYWLVIFSASIFPETILKVWHCSFGSYPQTLLNNL